MCAEVLDNILCRRGQLRAQQHLLLILHLGSLRLLLPHPLDPIYIIIQFKELQNSIQNFKQLLDRHA